MNNQIETKISKTNRLYAFICQVNQNIVRIKEEKALFLNSCRIAIEFGKFEMAWIGIFQNENKEINLVEQCGIPAQDVGLFTDVTYELNGPQGFVLRTGSLYVCNDIEKTPELKSWKPFAKAHGLCSCIVIPIKKSAQIVGTFNLYAAETDFFSKDEIDLLGELTKDISFGLDLFENKKKQKETEELLINTERKFRHTLDNLLEGVQIHDFDWKYIYVNDAAVKHSPYTRTELIGFTLMEKYPGIEQTELFKRMHRCMNDRMAEHFETEFVFPDGSKSYFQLTIDPIPEGISVLSIDKNETKVAMKLVEDNEKRFRSLIENSAEMITLSTKEGKILYGSPSIRKVFGYTPEEIPRAFAFDFVHPDDIQVFAKNRSKLLETPGGSYHSQLRLLHKTGKYIWCEATLTNRLEEPGINALVSNFRDISDQKRALNTQIESNNLIQTIYSASLDAVIIINADGIITKWNAKSEALFGWKEIDVLGTSLAETIIPERYRRLHTNGLSHYLKTGEGPLLGKATEVCALKSDGSEFDASLSISPSQINGEICFIGFIRDISEKKSIEKQREFDKNNLNALINNTTDLMWSVDLDTKLITFNQPFFEVIKLTTNKKVVKGDDVLSLVLSTAQLERFNANYARAFSGEKFSEIEYITSPIESWSEISFYPIFKDAEVIGTACHSRDITERKRAEESLAQNEKRLNEAQRTAHLGSWVLSFATNISIWSEEACTIYGLSPQENEHTYEDWLTFVHPEDLEEVMAVNTHAQQTLGETTLNHRIILKNGTIKHICSRSKFEFNQDGKAIGLHGTLHDVTVEKIAETNLKKSEEKYRQIIETSQEGIWQVDQHNDSVFVNKRLCQIFGYTFEEMMGKNTFDLLNEEGKIEIKEKIRRRKSGISEDFEQVYLSKSGESIWTHVSASPIMGDKGNYLGAIAMFTDITARKNAEIEKEKMTADLIQRNKDLEQFTYIVSHNLRAPVANIIGATAIMQEDLAVGDDAYTLTQGLHDSATKLDDVVKDLNHILQIKKEINESKVLVTFSELVDDIKYSIQNQIDVHQITISYDFSELNHMVTVKSYLYSVFYNLISNSIKYRQQEIPCVINIESRVIKNKLQLFFSDNGLGIDLQKRGDQVFGLYKRFHTNIEGKGMGLYMVKTQIEALDGKISIKSEVNKGTKFKIVFYIGV